MQINYEHCLPMKSEDMIAKRSAIIFRHGNTVPVTLDTGTPLVQEVVEVPVQNEVKPPTPQKRVTQYGHIKSDLREGKKLYTKNMLVKSGAHRYVYTNGILFFVIAHLLRSSTYIFIWTYTLYKMKNPFLF